MHMITMWFPHGDNQNVVKYRYLREVYRILPLKSYFSYKYGTEAFMVKSITLKVRSTGSFSKRQALYSNIIICTGHSGYLTLMSG